MALIEVGKIYQGNDGKTVLVFGVAERPVYKGSDIIQAEGIGINLSTGKVDEVGQYSTVVRRFDELDEVQTENFGFFYPVLRSMLKEGNLTAITGKSRSGKDTLASELVNKLQFKRTAFGDPIRLVHNVIYGKSDNKERAGLIMIGQGLRKEEPNIWVKTWLRLAIDDFIHNRGTKLVVSDVRQPNEFTFLKSMNALTVRIEANEDKRREVLAKTDGESALDEKLLNDETESYATTFDVDLIIYNEYDESYQNEMNIVVDRLTNDEG